MKTERTIQTKFKGYKIKTTQKQKIQKKTGGNYKRLHVQKFFLQNNFFFIQKIQN